MKYLLTGATGHFGSIVADKLLETISPGELAVSVRSPEKAAGLAERGVEVRHGDFDAPETLSKAFAGVDRLLLISADGDNETRIRQHLAAVRAAKEAGVGFIAYTSVTRADTSPLSLAQVHKATEEAIVGTGIPYAFLRNNWYLENEAGTVQAVLAGAPWLTSAGSGRTGWALRRDYAEAAAAVLAGGGSESRVYELSGQPLTQEELAAVLGEVIGTEVAVRQVSDEAYAKSMEEAGIPDFVVPLLVSFQSGIREGALDIESGDLAALLGRPLTPAAEGLRALAEQARG